MVRGWWIVVAGLGLNALAAGTSVAAQDDPSASYDQPSYRPPAQQALQPLPSGSAQAGNIIGYKPIPTSALEAALTGGASAPSAYPSVGAAGSQPPIASVTSQQPQAANSAQLPQGYLTGVVGEGLYTLGRDDVIRIEVQNQPAFTGDFVIGYDGRIQYNYLGDIPVSGLSKYEVQQVLEKLLRQYVRVPVVTVSIMAYNSKVVYVIGEVGRPGKFIMRGDVIKLREAILAAGLPTRTAALWRVHVIKPDLNKPKVRRVNIKRILYKGRLKDDVSLSSGEIVVVPSTVLSKVNEFLSALLSPVRGAVSAAALAAL